MSLQELVGDLVKEVESIHLKANYMRCMEDCPSYKLNYEGSQKKSDLLEEVAATLEAIVAKYIQETTIAPNRQINTLLRNKCIVKLGVIPMSKI